jgi:hypothetical protein
MQKEKRQSILNLQNLSENLLDTLPVNTFIPPPIFTTDTDKGTTISFEFKKEENQIIKSGRKRKRQLKEGERTHDRYCPDNILRRIQVHYLNFIIDISNELLNYLGYKHEFIDIDYNIKKVISKKKFSSLKKLNIGQIICQKTSPKFKNHDKLKNKNIFEEVNKDKKVNQFLSQTFLELFKDVYLKDKRHINENGLNFQLSEKVKTYEDLLNNEKEDDENNDYKKKINDVIQNKYIKMFKCKRKSSK